MVDQKQSDNTSYTLLGRAIDLNDDLAWEQLHVKYKRFIYHFLNAYGVNASDVDDLAQQVMIRLMEKLKTYDRAGGTFRSWLRTVVRNVAFMFFRKQKIISKYHDLHKLESETINDESIKAPFNQLFDQEWEKYIITLAMENLSKQVSPKAIQLIGLVQAGQSVDEIARTLNMATDAVYKMRARTTKSLIAHAKVVISDLEQ